MAQSKRVDVIANNLANVSTPAFRRDRITFQERLVEALEDRPDLNYYNALVDRHGGAPFVGTIHHDSRPGGYEMTGRNLDAAISGDGYFAVREGGTAGPVYYTRAGNFTLSSDRRLVTADGRYEVLGDDLQAVTLQADRALDVVIDPNGTVHQAGQPIATLAVRDFQDPSRLLKRGDNLYVNSGAGEKAAGDYRIDQGFLENSSADPLSEMVEMIQALRALESNLQMIRHQDALLDRSVNDFGRMPQR